nr:hypothetical protein [Tanacetum cinerariifolium]
MEEQLAREDQRMDEQIARDAKIARIYVEKELRMLINRLDRNNETFAKYLQEYEQFAEDLSIGERIELINDLVKYQDNYAKVLKYQSQQRKPLSKKQQREFYIEKFVPVWKQIKDFVPMGSKEEGERFKRKGLRLEQDIAKKAKTSEEVSEEDLKEMMQLVPVEEVYVEALQHFDREDLNQLWELVKETLNIRQATSDKEKELWVELKRLYESDVEDQLWTQTQALMHDPVEWRLYDSCGVHYVLSRDQEISMNKMLKAFPLPVMSSHRQKTFPLLVKKGSLGEIDPGLAVLVFKQRDDPIDTINKIMSFLSTVVLSRFPTTNNQQRNSSNPRQQATIHDGRVTVQPIQGRQSSFAAGTSRTRANILGMGGNNSGQQRVVKCFNCQGEGYMARQCSNPKRKKGCYMV